VKADRIIDIDKESVTQKVIYIFLQELSIQILSHFDSTTLCRIACVSRGFYSLATDERIWKELYYRDFKEEHAFYRSFFSDRRLLIWRILYRDSKWIEKR
jgi:hypothetical protein